MKQKRKQQNDLQNSGKILNFFLTSITCFYLGIILFRFSIDFLLFSFLSLAGIYVCTSIVLYIMGEENSLSNRFCSNTESCDIVLGSGKLFGIITIADIGLVYFIIQLLFLLLITIINCFKEGILLLSVPISFSLLASFISLLYQQFIAKHFCKMCLAVITIIWAQCICTVFYFINNYREKFFQNFVNILLQPKLDLLFIFCILFALTWLIIKPIVVKSSLANKYRKVLLEWKNNPTVFISLLKKQKIVPKEIWDQDFILGNRNAPIQIIAVLNPYCIFCKKVHFELNILLQSFPEKIYIINRFQIEKRGKKSEKTRMIVKYLLNAYFNYENDLIKVNILSDWFKSMDVKSWRLLYKTPESSIDNYITNLNTYEKWNQENSIFIAPRIFINGCEIPAYYKVSDLQQLLVNIENIDII